MMKKLGVMLLGLLLPLYAQAENAGDVNGAETKEQVVAEVAAVAPVSLHVADLTWPEIVAARDAGYTRILIPTAGIEQNGRHLPLNKHEYVVLHTAEAIAKELGNTFIAPVINHVPEKGHMLFPATISMADDTFYDILQDTIDSLQAHGFTHIYLLGDSGGNQKLQQEVAEDMQDDYEEDGLLIHHVRAYYGDNNQVGWLMQQGFSKEQIGTHAGIRDTSELMAVKPEAVRMDKLLAAPEFKKDGSRGDATKASVEIGKKMLQLKIDAAVAEIHAVEAAAKAK